MHYNLTKVAPKLTYQLISKQYADFGCCQSSQTDLRQQRVKQHTHKETCASTHIQLCSLQYEIPVLTPLLHIC